jgi:hypothetical protein
VLNPLFYSSGKNVAHTAVANDTRQLNELVVKVTKFEVRPVLGAGLGKADALLARLAL